MLRSRSLPRAASVVTCLFLAWSCSSPAGDPAPAQGKGGRSSAGAGGRSGAGGTGSPEGGESGEAGSEAGRAGGSSTGGASGAGGAESGAGGNGGESGETSSPGYGPLVEDGVVTVVTRPRPDWGALVVAAGKGTRRYVIESRRDVEPGPFGLPWRSRFRLAAYDAGVEAWSFDAEADSSLGGVAVHPSGNVTISVQHQVPDRMAYELVRLDAEGEVLGRTTLGEPVTTPETDFGPSDPRPLFRMKADLVDATTAGWVPLLPDGEGVATAVLSLVMAPEDMPTDWVALGLITFDWDGNRYVERWTRIVDGMHAADPAAWAYDEFRWREQAIRPFLDRDASSGELVVGRAWNNTRCRANVETFAEFTNMQCVFDSVNAVENERLPLAVTRFGVEGERLGTVILTPDEDAAEQVPFALTARDGRLAVAGAVVRMTDEGVRRTYPDADGDVDYDGYVAVYSARGAKLLQHDYNLGRGDVLAALRWTDAGFVAVGSSGWDRWQGGMSVSKGADPLVVWLSTDGSEFAQRTHTLSNGSRHFTLHDVLATDGTLEAYGFSDGPMTHSADNGDTPSKTFGPLVLRFSDR